MRAQQIANGYVDRKDLLRILFPGRRRPSLRWLEYQKAKGLIPFIKAGGVWYNVEAVRKALSERTVNAEVRR
jgi:hypothetical protein